MRMKPGALRYGILLFVCSMTNCGPIGTNRHCEFYQNDQTLDRYSDFEFRPEILEELDGASGPRLQQLIPRRPSVRLSFSTPIDKQIGDKKFRFDEMRMYTYRNVEKYNTPQVHGSQLKEAIYLTVFLNQGVVQYHYVGHEVAAPDLGPGEYRPGPYQTLDAPLPRNEFYPGSLDDGKQYWAQRERLPGCGHAKAIRDYVEQYGQ